MRIVAHYRAAVSRWLAGADLTQMELAIVGRHDARVLVAMTSDRDRLADALPLVEKPSSDWYPPASVRAGAAELARARAASPDLEPDQFLLILMDLLQRDVDELVDAAGVAKANGVDVYLVSYMLRGLEGVASSGGHWFHYSRESESRGAARMALAEIGKDLTPRILASTLVTDVVPVNMRYVPGSARPHAEWDLGTRTLSWSLAALPTPGVTMTYELQPLECGTWPTNVSAGANAVDNRGDAYGLTFPVPLVHVPCITPTLEPSPSPSATGSPTASPTAASSAVPSPTVTVAPRMLYLPLALSERCNPEHKRADIALVLDTSSSMTGQKIEDAKEAALLFVGMIDLAPGRSQVAVVRYDREAEVVRGLTRSRTLIDAAIRSLQVGSGTHIDKGLRAALGELQSPRHLDCNSSVMILLTDGLQTGTPGEELVAAEEVRDAGIRLYTIGLGSDVDDGALRAMAGDETRYYHAPDSADLASIYAEIAQDLMCPGTELWGGQ